MALGAALVLPACALHGLSLVRDDRVDILQPPDRAAVSFPLTVEWSATGITVGDGAGSYGVLLDRPPPPPGHTLAWLFRSADDCTAGNDCADEADLAARNVYRTTGTSLVLDRVPPSARGERRPFHEITVVLLDAEGRRIGESAWSVQFTVGERAP